MPTTTTSFSHGQWSSRLAFILAASGSAVGLGNIWKFPYMAGENGGGAFVLIYLLCIVLLGLPIMMAEVLLGRRGQQSPINTMQALAREAKASPWWGLLGWMGVLTGFLILSYYSVIAGWSLSYVIQSASGDFVGATQPQIGKLFSDLVASPQRLIIWHSVFMLMTMLVVARGVSNGLELAVRYLMPGLVFIILLLIGYAITQGHFWAGMSFLFTPDFSKINTAVVLDAMGQAFFTLSLGMGSIMVYGAYLPKKISIAKTSIAVAGTDTMIALCAGLAIFPIVFANQLEPAQGPGLIFNTLPIAFSHMPGGLFFGTLFFVLLVFAAWTSSISLIEPAVAYMVERFRVTRLFACALCGGFTWLVGLGTVFSFNIWQDYRFAGKTIFDCLDFLTANLMLPLGGFLIAIFVAWVMQDEDVRDEMAVHNAVLYRCWNILLRYFTPLALTCIFLRVVGVL
jgi:NSS family neurotransmitter:Na+ symporter